MKRRDLVNTLESLLGDSFDSSELVYLSDAELATLIHELQPAVETNKMPNGFTSWHETHYEVVQAITLIVSQDRRTANVVSERHDTQGHGGLYELAQELTDEFEKQFAGHEWDGEFYDTIEEWLAEKLA
jgi:hypothetical protein